MQSKIQNMETTPELPVEVLYNQSVEAFKADYAELAQSGEKMPALNAALRDMGVECDNDMSFFVMGAIGKTGMDMAGDALGMAANSKLGLAADVGTTAYGMADEARQEKKSTFKRTPESKLAASSKFSMAAQTKKTPVAPARKMATSILMASSAMAQKKKKPEMSPSKREELKKRLESHRRTIGELAAMKSCGYKYARRVTTVDQNGLRQTMLVPSEANAKMAFSPKARTHSQLDETPRNDNGGQPARRSMLAAMTLAA